MKVEMENMKVVSISVLETRLGGKSESCFKTKRNEMSLLTGWVESMKVEMSHAGRSSLLYVIVDV